MHTPSSPSSSLPVPPATSSPHVGGHAPPRLPRLALTEPTSVTIADPDDAERVRKKDDDTPLPPLVLRVAIRPGRMTLLTVVSIGSIIALVMHLHRGREIAYYAKDTMTPEQQSELLDKWNSYAGNVGAVFGKPIELFVVAAVQVLVLRFLTTYVLRTQPDRSVQLCALVMTTGVGYLISNGFNAINVQLHDLPVEPVIDAMDLTAEINFNFSTYVPLTTTVNLSIPESTLKNPSTNTVLRSLLLPREPKPIPQCDWFTTQQNFRAFIPDDVLEFGMPQRKWMKTLLPQALDAQRLRVVINATDQDTNKHVKAADLPMGAHRAANLFLHGLFLSSQYIPWGKNEVWDQGEVNATVLARATQKNRTMATAMLTGLIPTDQTMAERDQREWFLAKSVPMLSKLFANGTANMSQADIAMEFTHTQLAPSITFDAVTFDVDVDPKLYTTAFSTSKRSRYYALQSQQCSPWPGRCLIEKHDAPPFAGLQSDTLYDAPMQIHAYAVCIDGNGSEKMQSRITANGTVSDFNVFDCVKTSNSSILLVSVAKRLWADALLENTVVTKRGRLVTGDGAVAVNLTKTYSFTVGRLGWTLEDLATVYGAECDEYLDDCTGLSVSLQEEILETITGPVSMSGIGERKLIVGTDALPLKLLSRLYIQHDVQQRPMSLVQIAEPPRKDHADYNYIAGDILYPHNIHKLQWNTSRRVTNCSAHQEDRVRLVLDNHLYMETTRQATYTAGMFFLFQNGVPRDVVHLSDGTQTLNFHGNVHLVALWLSIPFDNMVLTITGCAVLAGALFVALIWSLFCRFTKRPDPLTCITTPHVIARAMLDESQFPSLLLHRRVMDTSEGFAQRTVAAFEIQTLMVQNQTNTDHRVAASA